ncbi:putative transcription factor interactor and regulator CCHC(Zn) family [Helianthus annuus]|nr:putative transcription factor interactor and regulator CCHC(Zn) family [Helianthus annuus]KAJ0468699.1 putative transcription factor interactor and regulator CCHC(Zn) family [Helianthus annuus]KAJ0485810.1 putative transcription factor interactor and regulator CCHC(Zn) family [Helianthus annuus]KAJ0656364.1 putative transcription factor interactor and regulator CCHC(Zn) family [Helianthus annuus]KAJ0659999.1 putative transcription factor interactor and regulator CCHC(Zn) family [Helianthus a
MEQRKISRMKDFDGEQDIGLYYKAGLNDKTNMSPKVETAFNAKSSSGGSSKGSNSKTSFSSYPSFEPNLSTTKKGKVLRCNIVLNLKNDQDYSEEIAKSHMSLLGTVLESYGSLVAGRIGNPMLKKEDYDQIDAEEMELMDIKWCSESLLRRAEKFKQITGRDDFRDANVSTLSFDKSKVTCFRCREKGHFKRECTNREASGAQNPFNNNDYYRKAIYHQVAQQSHQQEPQTAHANKAIEESSKRACMVKEVPAFKVDAEADAQKIPVKCENCEAAKKQNSTLIHNLNRLKESYDVLNKAMNQYNQSSSEQATAMKTLQGAFMTKQKVINNYIEKCAVLEQKLETQRIETERVNRLLKSYSCTSYVIDRIYLTVEGMKAFEEETSEVKTSETKKDTEVKMSGKKQGVSYNKCPPLLENGYSPRNPNSERVKNATNLQWESEHSVNLPENIDVTFTSSDTNHESELIKKVVDQVLDKDETEE